MATRDERNDAMIVYLEGFVGTVLVMVAFYLMARAAF